MKKGCYRTLFIIFCMALMIGCMAVNAVAEEESVIGDVNWDLDKNGRLTVSGNGEIVGYDTWGYYSNQWWNEIKEVVIEDGIIGVTPGPFVDCENLQRFIVSPDHPTLESIDGVLFRKADKTLISCPPTMADVYGVPEGTLHIGPGAFTNCQFLTAITIPDNANIGDSMGIFSGCKSLVSVKLPANLTSIGRAMFRDCTSLESLEIPDGVMSIGSGAFGGCYSLLSMNIPDGVTSIGHGAFVDCYSLQSMNIPDGVTSIENDAFVNCSLLQSVSIPDSVASIGRRAFENCVSLKTIIIPENVTSIGPRAFASCKSLESVKLPERITSIEYGTFFRCTSLQSIIIPDGVISIDPDPNLINLIMGGAFEACSSLQSVWIPDSVNSIADNSFAYCSPSMKVFASSGSYAQKYCKEKGLNFEKWVPETKTGLSVYGKDGATSVSAGKKLQMTAVFDNPELINKKEKNDGIIWTIANAETGESVSAVTIDEKGVLSVDKNLDTPLELLVKGISASYGTEAYVKITAVPSVSTITLNPAELFFYTGTEDAQTVKATLEPATVPPTCLTWTAVKNGIVEITPVEDGTVSIKPLKAGKTDIAVKEPGGKNAKLTVNVVVPVESLELKVNGKPKAGGKVKIAVTLAPKNVGNKAVQWSLDVGEEIATINEKGQLTISKTALSGTKITVTCTALGAPSPVVGTLVVEVP